LNLFVDEIFCPVDWSTRRSCKSSNNPPFFVVAPSFLLFSGDALITKSFIELYQKNGLKFTLIICFICTSWKKWQTIIKLINISTLV
jgi:hypothetical protein